VSAYQEAVLAWVQAAWRQACPGREFTIPDLAAKIGMETPALYRIANREGEATQETLNKIAHGLRVAVPARETVLRTTGDVQEPRTALEWVRAAQGNLEAATRRLEAEERGAKVRALTGQRARLRKRKRDADGEERGA